MLAGGTPPAKEPDFVTPRVYITAGVFFIYAKSAKYNIFTVSHSFCNML